jgi:hypothetical protein
MGSDSEASRQYPTRVDVLRLLDILGAFGSISIGDPAWQTFGAMLLSDAVSTISEGSKAFSACQGHKLQQMRFPGGVIVAVRSPALPVVEPREPATLNRASRRHVIWTVRVLPPWIATELPVLVLFGS